jgi:hypothetical protein
MGGFTLPLLQAEGCPASQTVKSQARRSRRDWLPWLSTLVNA